eukprot:SAG11_NODE_5588_length_1515_cov_4.312853_2_plen_136_part_00
MTIYCVSGPPLLEGTPYADIGNLGLNVPPPPPPAGGATPIVELTMSSVLLPSRRSQDVEMQEGFWLDSGGLSMGSERWCPQQGCVDQTTESSVISLEQTACTALAPLAPLLRRDTSGLHFAARTGAPRRRRCTTA